MSEGITSSPAEYERDLYAPRADLQESLDKLPPVFNAGRIFAMSLAVIGTVLVGDFISAGRHTNERKAAALQDAMTFEVINGCGSTNFVGKTVHYDSPGGWVGVIDFSGDMTIKNVDFRPAGVTITAKGATQTPSTLSVTANHITGYGNEKITRAEIQGVPEACGRQLMTLSGSGG